MTDDLFLLSSGLFALFQTLSNGVGAGLGDRQNSKLA